MKRNDLVNVFQKPMTDEKLEGGYMKEYSINPATQKVEVREKQPVSEPPVRISALAAVVDARMDADGHCTVCGCEVRDYDGVTNQKEMTKHQCPLAYRSVWK